MWALNDAVILFFIGADYTPSPVGRAGPEHPSEMGAVAVHLRQGTMFTIDADRERYTATVAYEVQSGLDVSDERFDRIYSPSIQVHSSSHWTPIKVAKRAAQLLALSPGTRVLDVGCGCGKFCIVGALTTSAEYVGVEQRPYLVDAGTLAARRWQVPRVSFVVGNMAKMDWRSFNGVYLFNPFYEQISSTARIDGTFNYNEIIYEKYLDIVKSKLRLQAPGTRVVTYYGFGGAMPNAVANPHVFQEGGGTSGRVRLGRAGERWHQYVFQGRTLRKQVVVLKHESDSPIAERGELRLGEAEGVDAAQAHDTGRGTFERAQDVQQRALAATRWAEDRHRFAVAQRQGDAVKHDQWLATSVVVFRDVLDMQRSGFRWDRVAPWHCHLHR